MIGMIYFFIGLVMLVGGYFVYGRIAEKYYVKPDDNNPTPAVKNPDGVDYVVLPHWKNVMIQLLNIAGIGPVVGLVLGIKFGALVFLILPVGNVLGGALHDYLSGMLSVRNNGANLPTITERFLGKPFRVLMRLFMMLLLALVVTSFINVPGKLLVGELFFDNYSLLWWMYGIVFAYYIIATLFPIDKIIGRIYPLFGAMLILSTFVMFGVLIYELFKDPTLLTPDAEFATYIKGFRETTPLIPVLFVTIACGIISGFHGTQSPLIARTMAKESQGRQVFYGTMIIEGIIGMVWGAMGMAVYNLDVSLANTDATNAMTQACIQFLGGGDPGSIFGILAILGVIVLALSTGDTAGRSLRLNLAEVFKLPQGPIANRLIIAIPMFAIIAGLLVWSNLKVGIGADVEYRDGGAYISQIHAAGILVPDSERGAVSVGDQLLYIEEGTGDKLDTVFFTAIPSIDKMPSLKGTEFAPITLGIKRAETGMTELITTKRGNGGFEQLWRYSGLMNQSLASITFMLCAVWLFSMGRFGWASLVPGAFMTFIVTSYFCWNSQLGFGMDVLYAYAVGIAVSLMFTIFAISRGFKLRKANLLESPPKA